MKGSKTYTSKLFFQTYKETPAEAEILSHKLMLRAGLIKPQASGIYSYLPMGLKVLRNIENIIREEMNAAGCQELLMPAIIPQEVYKDRIDKFGDGMFKLKDRNGKDFCLAPTHEELFTNLVKDTVKSYKNLPVILYQIQTKYRDERRPRFGLQRVREFIMKDAYSFDSTEEGLDASYKKMRTAYENIFTRLGLDFVPVKADAGAMGGSGSQEFMVKSEVGEDNIIVCEACGYAANEETAQCVVENVKLAKKAGKMEKVHTPNVRTMEEAASFFNAELKDGIKTLIYKADDELVAVCIRGDRDVQEVKLTNLLGCNELNMASEKEIFDLTGSKPGSIGPVGLNCKIIVDREVANMPSFIAGANEDEYHLKNVSMEDFTADAIEDIRALKEGDICPNCKKSKVKVMKGIEVGHIFKLGTTYSEKLGANVLDNNGKAKPVLMGCYGIGVGRTMASIVEQLSDEKGIIWPKEIAPYDICIIPASTKNEFQTRKAEEIAKALEARGLNVLFDDRNTGFGVKMKDFELLGMSKAIVVGRDIEDGLVELIDRKSGERQGITVCEVINKFN